MSTTLKHFRALLPGLVALGLGCGGSDLVLPSEGTAAKIVVVSGNGQAGVVGAALVDSLIVRVTDSKDRPVQNQQVTFAPGDANSGQPVPASATTNADGRAGATWVLGNVAGSQTMVAKPVGNGAPANLSVTFTATASSSLPAKLAKTAGDGQQAQAGTAVAIPPAVRVTDANGNPVAGVGVTFQVTGGGGTVAPTTPVATSASGIAAATSWTLGAAAGPNQLTASVAATGVTGNPAVFTATGVVGGANKLVFAVEPVNAAVGAPITPAVRVQVQDAAGNPVTTATNAITVSFGSNPTGAALGGTTTVSAVNGTATFSTLTVDRPGSGYTLTALASGLTSATSTAFNVVTASSTTTITNISPNSTVVGQPYSVSFSVAAAPPASGTPTGTVTVSDGTGTAPCTGSAPNGSCSLTSTTAGTKSVVATYAGDGNFAGSASAPQTHHVNQANTTTTVASSANPSNAGESVFFTATVVPVGPGSGTPAGTVQFRIDGSDFGGPVPLSGGLAQSQSTSVLTPGSHNVEARYSGSTDYQNSNGQVTQTVNGLFSTNTTLSSSQSPSVFGQQVTLTATVTSLLTPNGNVAFFTGSTCNSGTSLGSQSLQSAGAGTATASVNVSSLTVGVSQPLVACYQGNGTFGASQGGTTQTVNQAATTTQITNDLSASTASATPITVNYSVTVNPPGSGTPTGSVTVALDTGGGGENCTGSVAGDGTGSCTISAPINAGARTVTGTYSGDSNFAGSTSSSVPHTVTP
jgi:hypothetical protein